jgi:hypothetical protein
MNPEQLLRKLIVRAPPDLFAVICISDRARRTGDAPRPSWEEIVRAAEELGIFTAEAAAACLAAIYSRAREAV